MNRIKMIQNQRQSGGDDITLFSMSIQVTRKRSSGMFGLLYPLNLQRFTNTTDANSNVSSVYHHFLVLNCLSVTNIQSSGQLIALQKTIL